MLRQKVTQAAECWIQDTCQTVFDRPLEKNKLKEKEKGVTKGDDIYYKRKNYLKEKTLSKGESTNQRRKL